MPGPVAMVAVEVLVAAVALLFPLLVVEMMVAAVAVLLPFLAVAMLQVALPVAVLEVGMRVMAVLLQEPWTILRVIHHPLRLRTFPDDPRTETMTRSTGGWLRVRVHFTSCTLALTSNLRTASGR